MYSHVTEVVVDSDITLVPVLPCHNKEDYFLCVQTVYCCWFEHVTALFTDG